MISSLLLLVVYVLAHVVQGYTVRYVLYLLYVVFLIDHRSWLIIISADVSHNTVWIL